MNTTNQQVMGPSQPTSSTRITKFKEASDWRRWKFQISMILRHVGCYEVATCSHELSAVEDYEAATEQQKEDFRKLQSEAAFHISTTVEGTPLDLIMDKTQGSHMFKTLCEFYERRSADHVLYLTKELTSTRLKSGESVLDHVIKLRGIADQLGKAGQFISDVQLVTIVLNSLPPQYEGVSTALRTVNLSELTYERTLSQLQIRELEIKQQTSEVSKQRTETALVTKQYPPQKRKGGGACFLCGKRGHFVRDCPQRRRAKEYPRETDSAQVL
eukprot:TRINITY_DN1437_c0_g1_i4.p1 TRINITY_DN1437_c0_g1~~TRINITY_DN1437_c0_g1_i4.p1  ORF type:complete len:272 (+),score=-1.22 TRINITY_DN1437_c0_g1_i4:114-929(+)